MDELDKYLITSSVCEKTKEGYKNLYRRLITTEMFNFPIYHTNEAKIINILDTFEKSKLPLLNVCILLKKHFNKSISKLEKYRVSLSIKQLEIKKLENSETIKSLPSIQVLTEHMNTMYSNQNYIGYIVNYILINLNVRNMDLVLSITRDKKPDDMSKNYLILRSKDVIYVRNSYKTFSTYGQKRHTIKDKRFFKSCCELGCIGINQLMPNLTQAITRYTYDNFTEGDYFKAVLLEMSKERLLEISSNRGTCVKNILEYYDLLR